MKQLLVVAIGMLFLMGCEKEVFTANNLAGNQADAFGKYVPAGKGVQKIVPSQTDEDLIRGTAASIPILPNQLDEVVVKMGTWVTLRFSIQDRRPGLCPEAPTADLTAEILNDAIQFVGDLGLEITFDDQDIPIAPYFRSSNLSFVYVAATDECVSILPWRFYVNPHAKGSYDYTAGIQGNSFSRLVTWSPKSK